MAVLCVACPFYPSPPHQAEVYTSSAMTFRSERKSVTAFGSSAASITSRSHPAVASSPTAAWVLGRSRRGYRRQVAVTPVHDDGYAVAPIVHIVYCGLVFKDVTKCT